MLKNYSDCETIREKRWYYAYKLACRKVNEPSEDDVDEAKKVLNSFYRLSGLSDRLLYLQNEESTCNKRSTKLLEEKENRWIKRLEKMLQPYNATITYFSWLPSIVDLNCKGENLHLTVYYD